MDFFIEVVPDGLWVEFERAKDFSAVRQLEFASRLMYGLKPDDNNVWRVGTRSVFHISGFPPEVTWGSPKSKVLLGKSSSAEGFSALFIERLEAAIKGILGSDARSGGAKYRFKLSNGASEHEYAFHSRARTVLAFSVLFDLEWHPRKDLEIWINPDLTDKLPPGEAPNLLKNPTQYYGDPSKTADVLRNEGWAREAASPFMFVESRPVNGQAQQHYKLNQREQPVATQVRRTPIKPSWRRHLFEEQDFTCRICLQNYRDFVDQLSPDHRVPVVFEADDLNEENYIEKLMTLCRFCNQAKREFTKRLGHGYDWDTSPWAYPETFRIEVIVRQVKAISQARGIQEKDVLSEVEARL